MKQQEQNEIDEIKTLLCLKKNNYKKDLILPNILQRKA